VARFNLSLLSSPAVRLKDVDVILDQYSCIIFVRFEEIAKPDGFKIYNDLILRASLAYCHASLIVRFPSSATLSE
jgi:hypothetical protein